MTPTITLLLGTTEHLIFDEALALYAADQRYRADAGEAPTDARRRFAVLADGVRAALTRSPSRVRDREPVRIVRLTGTDELVQVCAAALSEWATMQELGAASGDDQDGLIASADVARSIRADLASQICLPEDN